MDVVGKVDATVRHRAERILKKIAIGEERPIRHKASGYLCVKVGYRYRLLKRNSRWELMSHEKYNRFINGARNK